MQELPSEIKEYVKEADKALQKACKTVNSYSGVLMALAQKIFDGNQEKNLGERIHLAREGVHAKAMELIEHLPTLRPKISIGMPTLSEPALERALLARAQTRSRGNRKPR